VAAGILDGVFETEGFFGGLLVAATAITGVVLILGSAGLRQNRAALELAYGLVIVITIGWLARGVIDFTPAALVAGVALAVVLVGLIYVRRLAIKARYEPRFLNLRQFETIVQVADAMIDGDGREAISVYEIAFNIDDALGRLDARLRKEVTQVITIVEWVLPLLVFRPFPFSSLGSHERRLAIDKVVGVRGPFGIFRDVARFLKLLSGLGYYSSAAAIASTGYIAFEERERGSADQTPKQYGDPIPVEKRQ
jgi:hypothetical protein